MPSSRCFCQPGTASQQGLSFQPGAVSSTRLFPAQHLFPARGSFQPRGCFQYWALSSPGFFPAKGLFQPRALSRQRRLPEPGLFPTTGLSKLFWAFSTARSFPTQPRGLSSQGSFPGLGSSPGWLNCCKENKLFWSMHPKLDCPEHLRSKFVKNGL